MELKNTTGIKTCIDELHNRLEKIEERLSKLNIDQKKISILMHGRENRRKIHEKLRAIWNLLENSHIYRYIQLNTYTEERKKKWGRREYDSY